MKKAQVQIFIILTLMMMILMAIKGESLSHKEALFYIVQVNILVAVLRLNFKNK